VLVARLVLRMPGVDSKLKQGFADILSSTDESEIRDRFTKFRQMVVKYGLGRPYKGQPKGGFRSKVWRLLLGAMHDERAALSYKNNLDSVRNENPRGNETEYYKRIRQDSYRAMIKTPLIDLDDDEPKLVRLMCVYLKETGSEKFIQGQMSLIVPFLVCMSEVDAYCCYKRLRGMLKTYYMEESTWECSGCRRRNQNVAACPGCGKEGPQRGLVGAYAACRLVDKVLYAVDPQLRRAMYRKTKGSAALFRATYVLRHMQAMSLYTGNLAGVMELWDLYFAIGVHLHIVGFVAQLILMRTELMDESTDINEILGEKRLKAKIDARAIGDVMTMFLLPKIDEDLMKELKNHGTDRELCQRLKGEPIGSLPKSCVSNRGSIKHDGTGGGSGSFESGNEVKPGTTGNGDDAKTSSLPSDKKNRNDTNIAKGGDSGIKPRGVYKPNENQLSQFRFLQVVGMAVLFLLVLLDSDIHGLI